MQQKTLKNIVLFCLCAIPFLAWTVSDGRIFDFISTGSAGLFFPFITGKNFGFRLLVEIAFIAWIFLAVRFPEYRPKKSPLLIAYSIFLGIIFIADIFGVDAYRSFFSNYERMEGFVTHLHLFAFFIMLSSVIRSKEAWLKYFKISLISNALVLLWAYLQLLGSPEFIFAKIAPAFQTKMNSLFAIHQSGYRLDSTLGNSAYFAIYAALFMGIAGILYLHETKKNVKYMYLGFVVANLIAMYYSGTRGTLVGLIAGLIVATGYMVIVGDKKTKKISLAVLGFVLAVVIGFISVRESAFVKNSAILSRLAAISLEDATTFSRVTLWKMSFEGFKERPILGYGQDNFGYVFARHFDSQMYAQEPWFDRSHNVFFDWLIAGGILGLLSYLGLFFTSLYVLIKKTPSLSYKEKALLIAVLVTYFVHNTLVFDNLTSYILFFTVLAYIGSKAESVETKKQKNGLLAYQYILEPVAVLAVLVVFFFSLYKPYITNLVLVDALDARRLASTMSLDKVLLAQKDSFEKALSYNSFGSQEVRDQFITSSINLLSFDPQVTSEEEKKVYGQSLQAFLGSAKKVIDEAPEKDKEDARELSLYGSFFNGVRQYGEAEKYLFKAHTISPEKQRISFELITTYLNQNKTDEAYKLAISTYLSAPKYADARTALAVASIYDKKQDEVKNLFKENNQEFPVTAETINAYLKTGNKTQAVQALIAFKAKNPDQTSNVDSILKQLEKAQ